MTAREVVDSKIREVQKDFGKNLGIFLETKDKNRFLVILDFFQTIPMGQMMKYVLFF